MEQNERLCVYNSESSEMFPSKLERNIKKICRDRIVLNYQEAYDMSEENLFECSKLIVFGTQYFKGQIILLPESSNNSPSFGQIVKLLSSEQEDAYFIYRKTLCTYDYKSDLYIIDLEKEHGVVMANHLADFHPLGLFTIYIKFTEIF